MTKPALNAPDFRLRLLGPPRIEGPDGILTGPVAQRHRLALLALLARAPGNILHREKLIGLLWPETDGPSARQLLNVSLHELRKRLGDAALSSEGDAVRLEASTLTIDVINFEAALARLDANAAVADYGGPFLDGLALPDAEAFEQWAEAERDKLERAYHAALERLADEATKREDALEAVRWWRRRLSCTPTDARVVLRTMAALARAGDRAGAIVLANEHAALLEREIGARPQPEVVAYASRLRTGDIDSSMPVVTAPEFDAIEPRAAAPIATLVKPPGTSRRRVYQFTAVAMVVTLVLSSYYAAGARERWARNEALPQAVQLVETGKHFAAFDLLLEIEKVIGRDAQVAGLLAEAVTSVNVVTTPVGVQVSVRSIEDTSNQWIELGRTPITDAQIPNGVAVYRMVHDSFGTIERVLTRPRRALFFNGLRAAKDPPAGMVYVPGATQRLFGNDSVQLSRFWIDRTEVTNRDYKQFVEAGGYARAEFWRADSRSTESSAISRLTATFRDRTGEPGPATWSAGTFPVGKENHPVGGISWYEAAAYCAFVGKDLPTIHDWYRAADVGNMMEFARFGNFGDSASVSVNQPLSIGAFGTYEMAGNVKEWVSNEAREGTRYILGGGWNEPDYQFVEPDARNPSDRESTFGVRCVKRSSDLKPEFRVAVDFPMRDARDEQPVDDEMFAVYRRFYDYDPLPLNDSIESRNDSAADWVVQRVSFAAAYGGERVPMVLFLPKRSKPPFQTVVFFPGAGAFAGKFAFDDAITQRQVFLFLVRAGRAVAVPMYKGTYERYYQRPPGFNSERDFRVLMAKDLRRSVDYLATRQYIDSSKLCYLGLSHGAVLGPIMTAIEPRIKASVLLSGGLTPREALPEAEPLHFLPRVNTPTLMVNGEYDFYFPVEAAQKPAFRLLGVLNKEHKVLKSGHAPDASLYRDLVLEWLDQQLGEVDTADEWNWRQWANWWDTLPNVR